MIKRVYTIRDEASGLFMDLQVNINNEVAIRNFDFAMAKNEMMNFHPQDFSLWYIGDYDDTTGILNSVNPQCIKRGAKKSGKA